MLASLDRYRDLGPLVVRIVLAIILLYHGILKFMATDQTVAFFTKAGVPAPGATVYLSGLAEVIGGVLILLGLYTRLAAIPLIVNFLAAIFFVRLPKGFEIAKGGFEWDLLLLASMVALLLAGAGGISLDARREAAAGGQAAQAKSF